MKIIQATKKNFSELDSILSGQKIIHIGVEHLHSTPLTEVPNITDMFNVEIDNQLYYINTCDILEYENLGMIVPEEVASILSEDDLSNDYTLITIGYEEASS